MYKAPYEKGRDYDRLFEKIIKAIMSQVSRIDDDFLMLGCGTTGSGKTALMLHAYELLDPEGADIKFIGLNRRDHAIALNEVRYKAQPRFCANDEADISKREAITRYVRDIISLYFAIRGLNIFHWWNNPSVDMIERTFIEERIKGMIFVATKDKDKPRLYYYFTKKQILKMYDKYGNLKLGTIKSHAKEYALYRGWFKAYKGRLNKDYLDKKENKMHDKVDDFFKNYGERAGTTYTINAVAKELGIGETTCRDKVNALVNDKIIEYEVHYFINPNGFKIILPEGLEFLKNNLNKYTDVYKKYSRVR